MRFEHREHDFAFENKIMGIQLKSIKTQSSEDVGESTRLDVQLDFSEIHVRVSLLNPKVLLVILFYIHCHFGLFLTAIFGIIFQLLREAGTSVLEILKLDFVSFLYIPIQVNIFNLSFETFGLLKVYIIAFVFRTFFM